MNGRKTTPDVPPQGSFNEPTDDDSINSLEVGARAVSSTIDLKVDVHRKNSSESSEELSLKPVIEDEANINEAENSGLLKETRIKTPDTANPNFRCKQLNSNKLRLKNDEGITSIEDGDFALSQSDCHIAKLRKDSIDDISEEYKMSQSDCHISKLRQMGDEKHEKAENQSDLSPINQNHLKGKEGGKKRYRSGLSRNLSSQSQGDKSLLGINKNGSFEMGNLTANGSCGVLPLNNNSNNKEQIKNTGSLELPLKDTEGTSSEKG